jgi:hypothetical protein
MGRTFLRQDAQVQPSKTYTDTNASGATMESSPTSLEDDLNNARSQLNRILDATVAGNWYDDIFTVNAKKRSVKQLNDDLNTFETKPRLCRANILTDVSVPATQNWVILSVAGGEAPTHTQAQLATTEGAVVAVSAFSGGGFGVHELVEVAGTDAINPANLCVIRDASTGQAIQSSGRDVFGLLQVESTGTDGNAFDDVSGQDRVKISFVRQNATFDDLEACPVADIQSTSINYNYVARYELVNLPEGCGITQSNFVDKVASVDVTLDNAIDNQVGAATQVGKSIRWQIGDTYTLDFEDSTGARDLLSIQPNVAGDEVELNIDTLDINNVNDADFLGGAKFDTGGTAINVGSTTGQIDAAGLTVKATGANDLLLDSDQEIFFDDANQDGSSWVASALKLSETSGEWNTYRTNFGEVSLINALNQAFGTGVGQAHNKAVAVVTTGIAANTNVTGAGGSPNIDAQLLDYSAISFMTDVNIYLNGQLLRNGADSSANHDVYPGTTPANGDLMFEFNLVAAPGNPDVITMETFV